MLKSFFNNAVALKSQFGKYEFRNTPFVKKSTSTLEGFFSKYIGNWLFLEFYWLFMMQK